MIHYLKARLEERSTWGSIYASILAAAMLPAPWSYALVAAGAIGALTPTSAANG